MVFSELESMNKNSFPGRDLSETYGWIKNIEDQGSKLPAIISMGKNTKCYLFCYLACFVNTIYVFKQHVT